EANFAQAEQQRIEARRQVAQQNTANGVRLLEQGNLFQSLVWFAAGLRDLETLPSADAERRQQEALQRVRLAAVLQYGPRLVPMHFDVRDALFRPGGP